MPAIAMDMLMLIKAKRKLVALYHRHIQPNGVRAVLLIALSIAAVSLVVHIFISVAVLFAVAALWVFISSSPHPSSALRPPPVLMEGLRRVARALFGGRRR